MAVGHTLVRSSAFVGVDLLDQSSDEAFEIGDTFPETLLRLEGLCFGGRLLIYAPDATSEALVTDVLPIIPEYALDLAASTCVVVSKAIIKSSLQDEAGRRDMHEKKGGKESPVYGADRMGSKEMVRVAFPNQIWA